jgi:hypothetical protein
MIGLALAFTAWLGFAGDFRAVSNALCYHCSMRIYQWWIYPV